MTQQEFTLRTMVQVSPEEYKAIEIVYMASDLQKDEFCAAWCKMNASRVKDAKAQRIIDSRDEAYHDALYRAISRWELSCDKHSNKQGWQFYVESEDYFNAYERRAMEHFEIKVEDAAFKTMLNIRHKIFK